MQCIIGNRNFKCFKTYSIFCKDMQGPGCCQCHKTLRMSWNLNCEGCYVTILDSFLQDVTIWKYTPYFALVVVTVVNISVFVLRSRLTWCMYVLFQWPTNNSRFTAETAAADITAIRTCTDWDSPISSCHPSGSTYL